MGKDKISIFITNLAVLLALESYTPKEESINSEVEEESIEVQIDKYKDNQIKIDMPKESKPVHNLPWIEDEEFLNVQEENDANILMAAYCAVLTEPLPGEEYNVNLAANSIKGIVVPSKKIFSQNESIGPYTKSKGYRKGASFAGPNIVETEGGGVCKIATTLYNVAILSDLEIIERHNHSMPVNYVPYGQDATVAYGQKDFKFKNNKDFSILIWSEIIGNRLYIGFYGQEESPKIEWEHHINNIVEAPTYYNINPDLEDDEEELILKGINGATTESKVIIQYEDGSIKIKNLGISIYLPLPNVIERSKK